jgi:hypothetical protein
LLFPTPEAAFAEPPTTTVTILEIKTDATGDSDVWGLRHPFGLSIRPAITMLWTQTDRRSRQLLRSIFDRRGRPVFWM